MVICSGYNEARELWKEICRIGYDIDTVQVYDAQTQHHTIMRDRIEKKLKKVVLVGFDDLLQSFGARDLLQGKGDIVIEFTDTDKWGQKTNNSRIVYQTMHPDGKLGNFNECVKNNLKYNLTIIILELYTDLTGTIVQSWVRDYNKSGSCIHICSDVAQLIADYNKTNFIEWEDHAQVNDRTVKYTIGYNRAWIEPCGKRWRLRQGGWESESVSSSF